MQTVNPYYNETFFSTLLMLIQRFFGFLTGNISLEHLANDEIQIIVLSGIAISSAIVGTFLILRKMTMLANSLSHTILLGIVGAYYLTHIAFNQHIENHTDNIIDLPTMLLASLCMGVLTSFLTEFLTKTIGVQEDASMGLVFTSLFALGIIFVTLLTRNAHIGTEVVMGNVDALHINDCLLIFYILAINLVLTGLFFKEYTLTTFDAGLANVLGYNPTVFSYLLMMQTAMTVVGAFRAVGVLMVLAFITAPSLTARMLTDNLKTLLILAALIGSLASIIGVALARHLLSVYGLALSTSGLVVCILTVMYAVVLIWKLDFFRNSICLLK